MATTSPTPPRVRVDGKFFRRGGQKFYLKGVAYGPFAPNAQQEPLPAPAQAARDLKQIRDLGANTLRLYDPPPRWFLDLALEHELVVLLDIHWQKDLASFANEACRQAARRTVREVVRQCLGHPALLAYSLGNEIPPDAVRWNGVRLTTAFIEDLIEEVKQLDPDCLCTYTGYPPTEFLQPRNTDFAACNVYLHQPAAFGNYLARWQSLAGGKPVVLSEFGVDSWREGEERKCELLAWQIETAFREGLAGTILFSYTDDWFRGGRPIEDWSFGLTTRDRQPKPSWAVVQTWYRQAPRFPLPSPPKVSVVVACYNGGHTLKTCLDSLSALNYPDYEVLLIDDGSTDQTPRVADSFPDVRYVHRSHQGLSAARNAGIAAARGEIIAFTDADCRADEDWLYYLVNDLTRGGWTGVGGPNLLPPEDSSVAAAVMVSPGGPAHVLLTDREAEHVPGCNMALYKRVLEEIGGFDAVFTKAGDDVDLCWRLREQGCRIGFSPAGFVWHYRRSTVHDYLRQQSGYGEAEALLERKHPEYFNVLGGGLWQGRIYSGALDGVRLRLPIIYHGVFASGFFQTLYSPPPAYGLLLCTTLEYHALVVVPLFVLTAFFRPLLPVALTALLLPAAVCGSAAWQSRLPKKQHRFWSRALVAWLFLLQPIVRGWARYRWRLSLRTDRSRARPPSAPTLPSGGPPRPELCWWTARPLERFALLEEIVRQLEAGRWQYKLDNGWSEYDLEIYGSRWGRLRLLTLAEDLGQQRRRFRCRLEASWSLRAGIALGLLTGLELLIVSVWASAQPWLWMLLLTVPLVAWGLDQENRNLEAEIAAVVAEAANRQQLVPVPSGRDELPHVP